ncbi:MAG: hypothetical protein GC205_01690 [Bacteroidetes bacterium]|nr:hypothetical protein [Bacteroidota bacterium]
MNRTDQYMAIKKVAKALGSLNEQVAFVGGAVVGIYVDDLAAEDVRPTDDLDITMAIVSLHELEAIRETLTQKGFTQSADDNVICRFRYEGIKVDVMNTQALGWAPANRWFAPGFAQRESIEVLDVRISVLPLPYFMASKFDAFASRGIHEPRTSHDLEDLVYILDNRTDIEELLNTAPSDVKPWLVEQLKCILIEPAKLEAVLGNLPFVNRVERFDRIISIINNL